MNFKYLLARRRALGIRQREIAAEMSISSSTLAAAESSTGGWKTPEMLERYARAIETLEKRWDLMPKDPVEKLKPSPELIQQVASLHAQGMKPRQIAETLGIGHIYTRQILERIRR
jgi:transcriptional regulator with XRE-family HTH domain